MIPNTIDTSDWGDPKFDNKKFLLIIGIAIAILSGVYYLSV